MNLKNLFTLLKARVYSAYLASKQERTPSLNRKEHEFAHIFHGRRYFWADDYLTRYSDIARAEVDPFKHFIEFGLKEGRSALFFDNQWYLSTHKDVAAAGFDGLLHYRLFGKAEGRMARLLTVQGTSEKKGQISYEEWHRKYGAYSEAEQPIFEEMGSTFPYRPLISVVMPVYKTPIRFLREAIESVLGQSYENFELCIADDASGSDEITQLLKHYQDTDSRVKLCLREQNGHISEASNSALELASGEFVALFDHDDLLDRNALFWVVDQLNKSPEVDLIYSDEDKVDARGRLFDPYFKSSFNYELFLAQNMICHLGVYRTALVRKVGGFRKGYEGSQDHDLALRVIEKTEPQNIVHIPRILYHWRAIQGSTALATSEKSYTVSAGLNAVNDHFKRIKVNATVSIADGKSGHFRIRYQLPKRAAKVSIIIPTRDKAELLKQCIDSIITRSTYINYEIVVLDNGSQEEETIKYFAEISKAKNIKVVRDEGEFNYSRINNVAVRKSTGKFICLMNNDIEVITPDWIEEMVGFAQQKDVGCVGARLWYPDKTLQHGGIILGIGGIAGHSHKYVSASNKGYFERAIHHQAFSAVTAACLMIKRSTYDEVGGLDEGLAVAFNDVDFCLRVRSAGYRNVWTPYAEMFHHESASRGAETTPEKQARFNGEVAFMKNRWSDALLNDPYYNPNLTLEHEDFTIASPPRVHRLP